MVTVSTPFLAALVEVAGNLIGEESALISNKPLTL